MSRIKHGIREIRQHYNKPYWWRDRYEHRFVAPFQQLLYGDDGIDVMGEDWDTLLILDACRADLFESVVNLDRFDDYQRVKSSGASTPEWTKNNFSGKKFGDTVYVTGNPQISKYAGDAFHQLIEVWDGEFDDTHRTVLPESVSKAALSAAEQYPNKRLIVHFMQPHTPFLDRDSVFPDDHELTKNMIDQSPEELQTMISSVGRETVWAAYRHTLEIALDEIFRVTEGIDGKTVISADHGELFGERAPPLFTRLYGHKSGIRYPDLIEVPWAVINGERRRIADDGTSDIKSDTNKIESQLEALGYK